MARNLAHWNKEYDRLERNSETALYEELGFKIAPRQVRRKPGGTHYFIARKAPRVTDEWLWKRLQKHKVKICGNKKLRALLREGSYATRDLFLVLIDILLGLRFFKVPIGTIAMILCRGGLKRLCGDSKVIRDPMSFRFKSEV